MRRSASSPTARTVRTSISLAEDGTLKAWEAAALTETKSYPKQPETVLAFALRPDGKQLAVGRYDGVLQLLDSATGKVQAEPLPLRFPVVNLGIENDTPHAAGAESHSRRHAAPTRRRGVRPLRRRVGQEVGVQAVAPAGSKLDPVVQWSDATGRVLAESTAGLLGFVCPAAGTYTLALRDRDYRGGPELPIGSLLERCRSSPACCRWDCNAELAGTFTSKACILRADLSR